MADLESVKVSDTLLIPVKVIHVDSAYGAPVKVAFETVEFWIDRDTAQAAEHISAPRVFKRGDWVRTLPEIDSQTRGIVTWVMSGGSTVRVHWPSNISEERLTSDLEPDEALE